jgi:hypothetical protein
MLSGKGDGINKEEEEEEESIKQIDNHDAHNDHDEQDTNKNKQINNDRTSSANTATANSDKLGDAAALKNHNMECKQTKDSAPPSSPDSQQCKQDATTSNVDKCSSTVTVTTEATKQKSTSSESAMPAGVVQDDKITGLSSVLMGVKTSCTVNHVAVEKQRDHTLPSKMSAISTNTSSTDILCSSTSDSTDKATTEE